MHIPICIDCTDQGIHLSSLVIPSFQRTYLFFASLFLGFSLDTAFRSVFLTIHDRKCTKPLYVRQSIKYLYHL